MMSNFPVHHGPEDPAESANAAIREMRAANLHGLTRAELEAVLPTLGMNNEAISEMPPELSGHFGKGLHFWQYPRQLAGLLELLRERGGSTYLEIGTRWGGTFVLIDHWLRGLDPDLRSYAMDLIPCPPLIEAYAKNTGGIYLQGDSHDPALWETLPDKIDVIFIDGYHSWEAVRDNFGMAMKFYPHTVIFHDTASDVCHGTRLFWQDLRRVFPETVEFHEQYASVPGSYLGIGVLCL